MRRVLLLLPLLTSGTPARDDDRQLIDEGIADVEVIWTEESLPLLSVSAEDLSAESVVRSIAWKLNISDVEGFEYIDGDPRVTVHLHEQEPSRALRWILGSVGIEAVVGRDSITVALDVGPHPDGKAMLRKAADRYFDSLKRFPDYPLADRAEMARAQVHERLGESNWGPAALAYDAVIEEYPRSEFVPEAMLRSARLRGKLSQWDQAALRYEELAHRRDRHPYHAIARLELAEALCRSGEDSREAAIAAGKGEKAAYVLDALDMNYPTQKPSERYERLLKRSRAQSLAGRPVRALQSIDAASKYASDSERDLRVLELRALALSRAGEHGASSTGWLAWAEADENDQAALGFVRAADEALLAGEELAVLMIEARADDLGFGDQLATAAAQARGRLGLSVEGTSGLDPVANLARGEAHVRARRWESAVETLRTVYRQREVLSPDERVRLADAYARSLHRGGHEEAAIDIVRAIVAGLEKRSHRQKLYKLAADLYEDRRNPRLDLAVEALRGRL